MHLTVGSQQSLDVVHVSSMREQDSPLPGIADACARPGAAARAAALAARASPFTGRASALPARAAARAGRGSGRTPVAQGARLVAPRGAHADGSTRCVRPTEPSTALVARRAARARRPAGIERPVAAHVGGGEVLAAEEESGVAGVDSRLRAQVDCRYPQLLEILVSRVRRRDHAVPVVTWAHEDDPSVATDRDGVYPRLVGEVSIARVRHVVRGG